MAKIKVFSLGGLDEVGKNCIVIEVNEQIFVFDSGLKYLNNIDLGINSVIPDFSFLIENQKKIQGLFLSKIETSKTYSISYLLKKIPHLNVYLTATSKEILKGLNLLTDQQVDKNLCVLNDKHLQFGDVKLQMFSTATSMPGSCGYILSTQDGDIVYTGSIVIKSKFNTNLFSTDLSGLIKEKSLPTLLLIQNVEQVATEGFTIPNNRIDNWIIKALEKTEENLYITCYENDWYKIYNSIKYLLSLSPRPKISFFNDKYGDFFYNIIKKVDDTLNDLQLIPFNEIKRNPKQKNVVFFTGDQKWLFSRVVRLLHTKSPETNLTEKDYVLLLGENKFNTELSVVNILNELYKSKAKIDFVSQHKIFPMEGAAEDLCFLLNLIQPRYFLPFNSYHKELIKAQDLAEKTGMLKKNIWVINNGEKMILENGKVIDYYEAVKSNSVFVDNINNTDISDSIISERKTTAIEGIMFIGFAYKTNKNYQRICSDIQIELRGVTNDVLKTNKIKNEIQKAIEVFFNQNQKSSKKDNIIKRLQGAAEKIIYKEVKKKPLIFPLIIEN